MVAGDIYRALRGLLAISWLTHSIAVPMPPLLTLNASAIALTRRLIQQNSPVVMPAYYAALASADASMNQGPWAVSDCSCVPPSGNKHDYMSVSKYYWPCNANPCNATAANCSSGGLPWVDCDGQVNTDAVNKYDLPRVSAMNGAVQALLAAYLFSGNETYAERAALLLQTWFLDPATAMRPNGDYMQAVPGLNNGSCWGIIEISTFMAQLLDFVTFLEPSPHWTTDDQTGLISWLAAWLDWLTSSKLGIEESESSNNHQTYYDATVVSAAVWTGNLSLGLAVLRGTLEPPPVGHVNAPLGVQVWGNGELPREEARTTSIGYVNMDSVGLLRLAGMSLYAPFQADGLPSLFAYVTAANGSSVHAVVDFITPFALGTIPWPHENIGNATFGIYFEEFRRAAWAPVWAGPHGEPGGPYYSSIAAALPGDNSLALAQLFWPVPESQTSQS